MTAEDKELLIRDLCARFPYGVKCSMYLEGKEEYGITEELEVGGLNVIKAGHSCLQIKPYLRSLSSMTEEELEELNTLTYHNISVQDNALCGYICGNELEDVFDWLNRKMFDYRGLIPKGLAIEASEGMYK